MYIGRETLILLLLLLLKSMTYYTKTANTLSRKIDRHYCVHIHPATITYSLCLPTLKPILPY